MIFFVIELDEERILKDKKINLDAGLVLPWALLK